MALGQAFGSLNTGKESENKLSALRESKRKIRGEEEKGGAVCKTGLPRGDREDFDACFFWLLLLDDVAA